MRYGRGRYRQEMSIEPVNRFASAFAVVIEHGGDDAGGHNEAGIFVARQIERDAVLIVRYPSRQAFSDVGGEEGGIAPDTA